MDVCSRPGSSPFELQPPHIHTHISLVSCGSPSQTPTTADHTHKCAPPIHTHHTQFFNGELWYAVPAAQAPAGDPAAPAQPGGWVGAFKATAATAGAAPQP